MNQRITNSNLAELLSNLGFESSPAKQPKFVEWRHPISGCALILPANKTQEVPRPTDLVGIKAQLNMQGHLDEEAFDLFVEKGRLPVALLKRS